MKYTMRDPTKIQDLDILIEIRNSLTANRRLVDECIKTGGSECPCCGRKLPKTHDRLREQLIKISDLEDAFNKRILEIKDARRPA